VSSTTIPTPENPVYYSCKVDCPGGESDFILSGKLHYIPLKQQAEFVEKNSEKLEFVNEENWWSELTNFDFTALNFLASIQQFVTFGIIIIIGLFVLYLFLKFSPMFYTWRFVSRGVMPALILACLMPFMGGVSSVHICSSIQTGTSSLHVHTCTLTPKPRKPSLPSGHISSEELKLFASVYDSSIPSSYLKLFDVLINMPYAVHVLTYTIHVCYYLCLKTKFHNPAYANGTRTEIWAIKAEPFSPPGIILSVQSITTNQKIHKSQSMSEKFDNGGFQKWLSSDNESDNETVKSWKWQSHKLSDVSDKLEKLSLDRKKHGECSNQGQENGWPKVPITTADYMAEKFGHNWANSIFTVIQAERALRKLAQNANIEFYTNHLDNPLKIHIENGTNEYGNPKKALTISGAHKIEVMPNLSVQKFFERKGIYLQYPQYPCIIVGSGIRGKGKVSKRTQKTTGHIPWKAGQQHHSYFPMEFVDIIPIGESPQPVFPTLSMTPSNFATTTNKIPVSQSKNVFPREGFAGNGGNKTDMKEKIQNVKVSKGKVDENPSDSPQQHINIAGSGRSGRIQIQITFLFVCLLGFCGETGAYKSPSLLPISPYPYQFPIHFQSQIQKQSPVSYQLPKMAQPNEEVPEGRKRKAHMAKMEKHLQEAITEEIAQKKAKTMKVVSGKHKRMVNCSKCMSLG
jgi:hypothetical protein